MMKWLRVLFYAGSVLAIGCNLLALLRNVSASFSVPLERRTVAGKHNMGEMMALVDKHLPACRRDLKLGIWYPFNDQVTLNHLNMIMTYHLYPLRAVTVQTNNVAKLKYITGYNSHMEQLKPFLPKLHIENSLVKIGANSTFSLLGRAGSDSPIGANQRQSVIALSGIPRKLIGMLIGFAALLSVGCLFLKILCPEVMEGHFGWKLLSAWIAGLLLAVLLIPLLGLIGLRISAGTIILVLIMYPFAALALYRLKHTPNSCEHVVPPNLLLGNDEEHRILRFMAGNTAVILSLAWCLLIIMESMSSPVFDITGLGVWGLKAKAFCQAGGIDFSLLTDPECRFCHPSYPLGFPLLLTYFYTCMGSVDDWLIRLVPAILGFTVFFFLLFIFTKLGIDRICGVIASLLFCSGTTFSTQSTCVEAETLLLLMCLPGFFCLMEYLKDNNRTFLWFGMLCLAGAGCTKQEGLVIFAVGVTLTGMISRGFNFNANPRHAKQDFIIFITIVAVLLLPWHVYCRWKNLPVNDFQMFTISKRTADENALIWSNGIMSFINQMFYTPSSVAWIWTVGAITIMANRRVVTSRKEMLLLLGSCSVLITFFGSIYLFSTYPMDRLDWHMLASERLLLLPTGLFLILVVCLLNRNTGTDNRRKAI